MKIEWKDLESVVLDGVEARDYPDMSNATITSAILKSENRRCTDEELDYINEEYAEEIGELAREAV